MQPLTRGAPHGVVSLLSKQRIMVKPSHSNLIGVFTPFKTSLPVSRLKVCSCLELIPNVVKKASTLMITESVKLSSLIPHKSRLVKIIVAYVLFRVVLDQIHKRIWSRWKFLNVNDLITTEFDGTDILGFVERKERFGITIKMKNGDWVLISEGNTNGVITKIDHQMKNEERVNWRFSTELEIKTDQIDRIKKEIYKIFQEDKDLEQEDSLIVVYGMDFANRTAVLLVSCFTKTNTHEDYFSIRDALLLKLRKLT